MKIGLAINELEIERETEKAYGIKMKAPYRGWLGRAADQLGLKYYWDESAISSSRYFVVWWEPDDEDERFQDDFSSPPTFELTFRVSDHSLPPTYVLRNVLDGREVFEVGSHLESDGDMKDAVAYLKRWFDPDRIQRKLDAWRTEHEEWLAGAAEREAEAAAWAESVRAREERAQALFDQCLADADPDLVDRFLRIAQGAETVSREGWREMKRQIFGHLPERDFNEVSMRLGFRMPPRFELRTGTAPASR